MSPVRSSRRIRKEPPPEPEVDQVPAVGKRVRRERTKPAAKEDDSKVSVATEIKNACEPSPVKKRATRNSNRMKKENKNVVTNNSKNEETNAGGKTPLTKRSRPVLKDVDVDQVPLGSYKKVVVTRTSSFKDTFPGRLEWKKRHYDKPVTSTPVGVKTKLTESVLAKEVDSCFGFDDSTDTEIEEYRSTPISPIVKLKDRINVENKGDRVIIQRVPQVATVPPPPAPPHEEVHHKADFNELYEKYECSDEEIHFNREGTKHTYSHTRKAVNLPVPVEKIRRSKRERSAILNSQLEEVSKKPRKEAARPKKKLVKEEAAKAEYDKLAEKMMKQFEEIEKVPLVIEKSFDGSDEVQ